MPVLTNPRWEAFAAGLAKGKTGDQAYQDAGYAPNRGNAARLKANESILARMAELREMVVEKATVDRAWVLARLVENANRALQALPVLDNEGNPTGEYRYEGSVANRALELVGKEFGMFVERKESGKPGDFAALDRTALEARLYDEYRDLGISDVKARALVAAASGAAEGEGEGDPRGKPH